MQHVFIIGSKSIGRYGGFETFVDRLTALCANDKELVLHVACKANGEGCMDETLLSDPVTDRDETAGTFTYHGARCFKLHVPQIGPAQAIWYDVCALKRCCLEIEEQHLPHPVVYILACRIGPFAAHYARRIRRAGGRVFVNPDGHEWMRAKWSAPVRRYWKYSEKKMVQAADLVVCDNPHIESYIKKTYAVFAPETTCIAYGADLARSALADDAPAFVSWLSAHGLEKDGYYLIVGRFIPENNYEVMLREFLRSETKRRLVIVSTENPSFAAALDEKLHYTRDLRIVFAGPVYDSVLLLKIRECAFAYLHGHEVGGTNPSLLEALAATSVNLLLDVSFNRAVGRDGALYWTKEEGVLAALIDRADAMDEDERSRYETAAKKRIADDYRWEDIVDAYRRIFTGEEVSAPEARS